MRDYLDSLLKNRYLIERRLGSGGMAVVYEGRDQNLFGRRVAIKVIDAENRTPDFLARFQREAQALAGLEHPNVVVAYDYGEEGGAVFIVMRLLTGGTLTRRLEKGPLSPRDAARILLEIASGMDYAHSHQVIHRDLKPSNILFTDEDRAVLADFGIALFQGDDERQTQPGLVIGTATYTSPEVLDGKISDHRSDIYSLGVVAYEMLAGTPPFVGESLVAVIRGHLMKNPESLRVKRPDLPEALDTCVLRALAKDPRDRWQSAGEFARAVTAALEPGAASPGQDSELLQNLLDLSLPPRPDRGDAVASLVIAADSDASPRPADEPTRVIASPAHEPAAPRAIETTQVFSSTSPRMPRTGPSGDDAADEDTTPGTFPPVRLVVTESADRLLVGQTVQVTRLPFVIGRSSGDFRISGDRAVSREHAILEFRDGMYWIRDTGSSNGTFVNGRRIPAGTDEPLLFGAELRLSSSTCITFAYEGPQALPDLAGKLVDERYLLTRLLRSSARAAVYAASDTKLPQEVALKILSPQIAAFPGYVDQFEREARLAAQLNHPHICGVIDFGVAPLEIEKGRSVNINYLCMKMMPGGSLADRTGRPEQKLPLDRVYQWVARLAAALDYAHRSKIVHRGIKPTSIIFDSDENPFLTDFAIAYTEGSEPTHEVVGAPAFLAPEQWENLPTTPAVDQYALAAVTYLMVTGSHPYEGQEHPTVRRKNLARGPVPAHVEAANNGRPDLPPGVSEVLHKALAKEPAERYENVLAFARSFEEAIQGRAGRRGASPRVFISYQRDASAGWAVYFAKELKDKYGIEAFVDTQRLDGVVQFPERLRKAIEECDIFVCMLARKTLSSKWVQEEIRLAYQKGRPMVPIFQESYKPPAPSDQQPHFMALLNSDGLHLLDRRNIHVEHTVADLARLVRQTFGP